MPEHSQKNPEASSSGSLMPRLLSCHLKLLKDSRPEVIAAATLLLVPAVAVFLITDPEQFRSVHMTSERNFLKSLMGVLTTNLPSALFLFAGVITLGLTAGVGCIVLGLFLGFSVSTAVGTFGVGHVIAQTWLYTPFEVYGFVLAGASGLVATRRLLTLRETPLQVFRSTSLRAFSLLAHSMILLSISAVLEAAVTL